MTNHPTSSNPVKNTDPAEIAKFDAMAATWWDPNGPCKPLHEINPIRLAYILSKCSIEEKKVLDIGCGGGILTESLASLGAKVIGLDQSFEVIKVAKMHWQGGKHVPPPTYVQASAEEFASQHPKEFDVITCMELLEHVPDPNSLLHSIATLLSDDGKVILSTLNRTPKSYLYAILGAEYVLKMLPKGTHDYRHFIRPSELEAGLRQCGLKLIDLKGMSYNPFTKNYNLSKDISVNYLAVATKS